MTVISLQFPNNLSWNYFFSAPPVQQKACPRDIKVMTSPLTNLADVELRTSAEEFHKLSLPIGTYNYNIVYKHQNCSTTVRVFGKSGFTFM